MKPRQMSRFFCSKHLSTTIKQHHFSTMPLRYIPALTGVRAIAAYLVFFYHFNPLGMENWGGRLLHEGHIGVSIFFVLSGFLITLRYWGSAELNTSWLKQYFLNRFSRIYPLYALLTIFAFCMIWQDGKWDPVQQWVTYTTTDKIVVPLLNLTFLRGFFDMFKFTGIAQGWTLTVEETFYALAPLLLVLLAVVRRRYLTLLVVTILFLGVGCGLVRILPHYYGLFGSLRFMFAYTFFGRAVEFMLGAALSLFVRNRSTRNYHWLTWIGVLYIVACMVGLSLVGHQAERSQETTLGIVINNLVLPVGICIFFYGLITERTWLAKLLETKTAQLAGKTSYAFYLIHQGILHVTLEQYVTRNAFVIFAVALVLSWALWKWIEEPLNHRFRRLAV
ncbi:acyltransferase family protein [Hymenobacter fodinae]|uniref:Acyltransferase n=1 Tax=Hymenobacter fodinae TaxID=2510796 RepID=A0A4Z0PA49_9BACT|nr:acyltransferase [Hymenobacter fodinae]TGE08336.1 acyltransferase [Hymenobacter fodinae]